jgi:hypothetical protein
MSQAVTPQPSEIARMHAHQPVLTRRQLLAGAAGTAGLLASASPLLAAEATADAVPAKTAESLAATLHGSLSDEQRKQVCFPWDYKHPKFGLLRTRVGNNWNATEPEVSGKFFTADQKQLIRDIFEQLIEPEWHAKFDKQMEDDCGGFGHSQSIALIGEPGSGKFQFLMTGRHMTLRCDGDAADHVAFGGPIFYGHDAGGFNEEKDHPGNVFWPQALAANRVYDMLDGKQRSAALVDRLPKENAVAFRGKKEPIPGLRVSEMAPDQRAELEKVLAILLEPYRTADREEVRGCLERQGGLDDVRLVFYSQGDIGNDKVWDNWRLEGPAFVWHFRGAPHVHVWVNVADSSDVPTNA